MQETFLAAYKGLADFDRRKEQAWICRIALNKCLDFLKNVGRRQIPVEDTYFVQEMECEEVPEKISSKRILPYEIYNIVWDLCYDLPEVVVAVLIIWLGIRLIKGKKKELEQQSEGSAS